MLVANSESGTQAQAEVDRSNLKDVGIDVSATNDSRAVVFVEDSTLSGNATAMRSSATAGSWVQIGLTRSKIHTSTTAVDHGYGQMLLNTRDIVWNTNSIVNNGSGDVKALLNNLISQNTDSTTGFVYVTPPPSWQSDGGGARPPHERSRRFGQLPAPPRRRRSQPTRHGLPTASPKA